MAQGAAAKQRVDFLRHIVNRVLATKNVPPQVADDMKKAIGKAEDKYRFDAFGGNIKGLAEYIRSRDFNDVVLIARSNPRAFEALREILEEAKRVYSDEREVVEAIEERLRELEKEEAPRTIVEELAERLEEKGFKVTSRDATTVKATKDGVMVELLGVEPGAGTVTASKLRLEVDGVKLGDAAEAAEALAKAAEEVAQLARLKKKREQA